MIVNTLYSPDNKFESLTITIGPRLLLASIADEVMDGLEVSVLSVQLASDDGALPTTVMLEEVVSLAAAEAAVVFDAVIVSVLEGDTSTSLFNREGSVLRIGTSDLLRLPREMGISSSSSTEGTAPSSSSIPSSSYSVQ